MSDTYEHGPDWPSDGLESVDQCAYCGSKALTLTHPRVRDWSFWTAPGTWSYWTCQGCQTLVLSPRPSADSIHQAYGNYYTHRAKAGAAGLDLKQRWRNERLSVRLAGNIEPRLHLPALLHGYVAQRAARMHLPFGWELMASLPRGRLVDVGCGSGKTVALAAQLGWQASGIEIDEGAVKAARAAGVQVQQGGYELLTSFEQTVDCLICSHVIEHVHEPLDLLRKLHRALKPGGTLLLSCPNALSDLHAHFGANWRGLEAPRHLAIPSEPALSAALGALGFQVQIHADLGLETAGESLRIARRARKVSAEDRKRARQLAHELRRTPHGNDFVQLVCTKRGTGIAA